VGPCPVNLSGGRVGLRFDPVGGGRFKEALNMIIESEGAPIRNLEGRKEIEKKKLELFNQFKSKFTGFRNKIRSMIGERSFKEFRADVGTGKDLMSVRVDKASATPGNYTFRIEELAERSSMMSSGYEDPDEKQLGIGYVVVYLPNGDTHEVYIGPDDASLNGVAGKINGVMDSPINATVVRDASEPKNPYKLIINAVKDGEEQEVEFPEFYFLDPKKEFWIQNSRDAQNAIVEINDHLIEVGGNEIENFFTGVHVKLLGADPKNKFTLKISEDTEAMAGKMKEVITNLNEILQFINTQNQVTESSDTKTMFTGDTSLQTVEYRIRNLLHEGFAVWDSKNEQYRMKFLHQMGVGFDRSGKLNFDDDKFKNELEEDLQGVVRAVSGEMGFAYQLSELIATYTNPFDGLLQLKEKTMQGKIKSMDKNIANKERLLKNKSESLVRQFSRLQGALGNMQQQQAYMQANLGGGGGGNLVSQLLG